MSCWPSGEVASVAKHKARRGKVLYLHIFTVYKMLLFSWDITLALQQRKSSLRSWWKNLASFLQAPDCEALFSLAYILTWVSFVSWKVPFDCVREKNTIICSSISLSMCMYVPISLFLLLLRREIWTISAVLPATPRDTNIILLITFDFNDKKGSWSHFYRSGCLTLKTFSLLIVIGASAFYCFY